LLRQISHLVARRAASLLAVAIHAFWLLRIETSTLSKDIHGDIKGQTVAFACNGGIVLKYPGFLKQCQEDVDALVQATGREDGIEGEGNGYGRVILDLADEAAVYGAAVAAMVAKTLDRE
jgi:hexokinase